MPELDEQDLFCAALEDDVDVQSKMPSHNHLIKSNPIRSDKITMLGFGDTGKGSSSHHDKSVIDFTKRNMPMCIFVGNG